MNYEVGDILKDKDTDIHFMIIKKNPATRSSTGYYYKVKMLSNGDTDIYGPTWLVTNCIVVQRGRREIKEEG